jgi:hypothetical protein
MDELEILLLFTAKPHGIIIQQCRCGRGMNKLLPFMHVIVAMNGVAEDSQTLAPKRYAT